MSDSQQNITEQIQLQVLADCSKDCLQVQKINEAQHVNETKVK